MNELLIRYQEMIARFIIEYGHAVTGVTADPQFFYTTGLHGQGLPELLVIGNMGEQGKTLLNAVAAEIKKNGAAPRDVNFGGAFSVRLREVTDPALVRVEYTIQTGQHYGREDYDVMQVLVPDKTGHFPGEAGVDPRYDTPVL